MYVKCSLDACESRDTESMHKKARTGVIKNFTGINDEFEALESPEIILNTEFNENSELIGRVLSFITIQGTKTV